MDFCIILINELQPDIMIMFGKVGTNFVNKSVLPGPIKQTVYKTPKGKDYFLSHYDYKLGSNTVKIITTPYWSRPFSPYKITEVKKDLPTLI